MQLTRTVVFLLLAACATSPEGPGTPTRIAVHGGDDQTGQVITALSVDPSVIVHDASGRPVPGVTIRWAVTSAGGSVAPSSTTTVNNGVASATWILGPWLGVQTLTAAVAERSDLTVSLTATALASDSLIAGRWRITRYEWTNVQNPSQTYDYIAHGYVGTFVIEATFHTAGMGLLNPSAGGATYLWNWGLSGGQLLVLTDPRYGTSTSWLVDYLSGTQLRMEGTVSADWGSGYVPTTVVWELQRGESYL